MRSEHGAGRRDVYRAVNRKLPILFNLICATCICCADRACPKIEKSWSLSLGLGFGGGYGTVWLAKRGVIECH